MAIEPRRPVGLGSALTLIALAAVALGGSAPDLAAQEFEVSGQVRPRTEGRTPVDDGGWDYFTSMRTRIGVLATLPKNISAFVQLQDVRLWGSESSTTDFSADGFDLHQGYLDLAFEREVSGYLRVASAWWDR
jgi:hypothetical protein